MLTVRGDAEVDLRQAIAQISPAQYGELVQRLANNIGYAGTTSKPEIGGREDTEEPVRIGFDYKRDRAGDWANLRIVPQLAPIPLPRPDTKEPPVGAIELGAPLVIDSKAAMKLPPGWSATLPDPIHEKCAYASFDQSYRQEKGTVYTTRKIQVLQQRVPQADWKTYSRFAEAADLGNERYIVLARASGEKAAAVEAPTDASAPELIRDALEAVQQHDETTAEKLLTRAQTLSPQEPGLWGLWGALHGEQGKWALAEADLSKELQLHPDMTRMYPALLEAESKANKPADVEATLKAWSAAQPEELAPARGLVSQLTNEGKYAEAVAAGQDAEKRLPEDRRHDAFFQIALGKAELKTPAGKEAGHVRLVALLGKDAAPGVRNDASYELADAGLELPLAESNVRQALAAMDAEGAGWTLDNLTNENGRQINYEIATWDTMGWIFYREGKPAAALEWVQASWTNRQSAEVGEHLGELYAAAGDRNRALGIYKLARSLAAISMPSEVGVLDGRIAALEAAGAKQPEHSELGLSRSIALGGAKGVSGSTEYKVLLRAGRVVQAVPTDTEAAVKGGAERLLQAPMPELFPPGSAATLPRKVILNCYGGKCTAYLED